MRYPFLSLTSLLEMLLREASLEVPYQSSYPSFEAAASEFANRVRDLDHLLMDLSDEQRFETFCDLCPHVYTDRPFKPSWYSMCRVWFLKYAQVPPNFRNTYCKICDEVTLNTNTNICDECHDALEPYEQQCSLCEQWFDAAPCYLCPDCEVALDC